MNSFGLAPALPKDLDFGVSMALLGLLLISPFVALLYAMLSTRPWHPKRRFRGQVRRALRPLDPTLEQLQAAVDAALPPGEQFARARQIYRWIQ